MAVEMIPGLNLYKKGCLTCTCRLNSGSLALQTAYIVPKDSVGNHGMVNIVGFKSSLILVSTI